MNLIPDVPAKLFTLSAIAFGYILIDDLTANEQNALGNWLMLTAQVLCTNAFYKQVEQERQNKKQKNYTNEELLAMLEKAVRAMNEEINNLKRKI